MLFVLPKHVSQEFIDYYFSVFGKKELRVLVPKSHSGVICEDIMKDEALMQELVKAANGQKRLVLKSYTASQQFLDLVRTLRDKGLTIFTPESPEEEDAWTVNFYGSKSGIRQLSQQSRAAEPDLMMPEGIVVSGIIDAARIAANKYIKERGVVIKTNKGHSGAGVLIIRDGELPTEYAACQRAILDKLKKDSYWDLFPIVVESFISVNKTVGGGFPNVEFKILKNGHVEFLYYCGMRVNEQGVFAGVEIQNEVISDQAGARMVDTGFFIGEKYREAGYRGYFDVDFVAAKNGQLYVTESNVRRTGGSHVYHIAEELFGKDFMYLTYILSNNAYKLPETHAYTFSEMITLLHPILFSKQTKEGIVVISENLLSYHEFGYVIFGATEKRANEIESRMVELLMQPSRAASV